MSLPFLLSASLFSLEVAVRRHYLNVDVRRQRGRCSRTVTHRSHRKRDQVANSAPAFNVVRSFMGGPFIWRGFVRVTPCIRGSNGPASFFTLRPPNLHPASLSAISLRRCVWCQSEPRGAIHSWGAPPTEEMRSKSAS